MKNAATIRAWAKISLSFFLGVAMTIVVLQGLEGKLFQGYLSPPANLIVTKAPTMEGATGLEREIITAVFQNNGVQNPRNSNTGQYYLQIRDSQGFRSALSAVTNYLANPVDQNKTDIINKIKAIKMQYPDNSTMETLFLVYRDAIGKMMEGPLSSVKFSSFELRKANLYGSMTMIMKTLAQDDDDVIPNLK